MKKFLILLITLCVSSSVFAKTDKTSAEYLRDKKHLSAMNPLVEKIAEKAIKKSLKKECGGKYKVEFDGYTLGSMKVGIFKNLLITGKNLEIDEIEIPYLQLKSVTDYNWIDYRQDPMIYKSDMEFSYSLHLNEDSINSALKSPKYKKNLDKINQIAYPLFILNDTQVKIKNDKLYILMEYNLPLSPFKRNKVFIASTGLKIQNNRILAKNVNIDKSFGNIPINKVTNLINLLDPLTFTLSLIETKDCQGEISSVKIIDDIIEINGKINIKKSEIPKESK